MDLTLLISYMQSLQARLAREIASFDGLSYQQDKWCSSLGVGNTMVLEDCPIIERSGVNFSHITANNLPKAALERHPELTNLPFEAVGVSTVTHPRNPFIPTSHMNIRYLQVTLPNQKKYWWFAGGFDLTPFYPVMEDVICWHKAAQDACNVFSRSAYSKFKKSCDEYFYLPHRNETRGVGGIFFDDINQRPWEHCFNFIKAVGNNYLNTYVNLIKKYKNKSYNDSHRRFQAYRRARYVEFNLLYDRGTHFGLQSKGRIESILVSMPPKAEWRYNFQPQEDSLQHYLQARDWLLEKEPSKKYSQLTDE